MGDGGKRAFFHKAPKIPNGIVYIWLMRIHGEITRFEQNVEKAIFLEIRMPYEVERTF